MKKLSSAPEDRGIFTVLSVSSQPEDHRNFREMVPGEQFRVQTASSCGEAAQLLSERAPAVVACDLQLPDGSWKDLLRRMSKYAEPPPLIVTARLADERLWAEVLNLGGYDVLAKPLDRTEVSRVLKAACRVGKMVLTA